MQEHKIRANYAVKMPRNRFIWMLALPFLLATGARSDPSAPAPASTPAPTPATDRIFGFMNRLPELINNDLPFLAPRGTYWFYARPSVGNPFQGKYFRLNGGMWVKATNSIEFTGGAQTYLWRDPNDNDATRGGFYGVSTGVKYSHPLPGPGGAAMSAGLNFTTPVSRPPLVLVDGYRHTDPYLTFTRPISARLHLVGFATIGADLLAHTSLPSNFGANQLHSNSLNCTLGATREFRRFTASLTVSGATTALMSRHNLQVFNVNPRVIVPAKNILPFLGTKLPHWHINLVGSAYAATGPDGRQTGASASVNVNFDSRSTRAAK